MIDFDNLPIRCRIYLNWKHKANECKMFQKEPLRGKGRPMHAYNSHHQEKGRKIEKDQDGFQHVKSRKTLGGIFLNTKVRE